MRPLAFIAGSKVLDHPPFAELEPRQVDTPYGAVEVYVGPQLMLVMRHGPRGRVPPHAINHRANIDALRQLEAVAVVALCSVGSLKPALHPGMLVVPDDFINLAPVLSFFDDDPRYVTPIVDPTLRQQAVAALERIGEEPVDGGVYFQTTGPRLETKAEVRLLAQFADVVGMTFGHEATLANEAGLPVGAVCTIDNMAHGLPGGEALTGTEILRQKRRQTARFAAIAASILTVRS